MVAGYKGNITTFIAEKEHISTKEAYALINNFYTLKTYAMETNLSLGFLKQLGLENATNSVKVPYYDRQGQQVAVKYISKNNKSRWEKGSKVDLYGLWKLKEFNDKSYIIFTIRRDKFTYIMVT